MPPHSSTSPNTPSIVSGSPPSVPVTPSGKVLQGFAFDVHDFLQGRKPTSERAIAFHLRNKLAPAEVRMGITSLRAFCLISEAFYNGRAIYSVQSEAPLETLTPPKPRSFPDRVDSHSVDHLASPLTLAILTDTLSHNGERVLYTTVELCEIHGNARRDSIERNSGVHREKVKRILGQAVNENILHGKRSDFELTPKGRELFKWG